MCSRVIATGCWSAGSTSTSGWSSRASPRSTSRSAVTAVTILVIDATANRESSATGTPSPRWARPPAYSKIGAPSRQAIATPRKALAATCRSNQDRSSSVSICRLSAVAADRMRR